MAPHMMSPDPETPDASQELALLRCLAVAVLESRRSGNQDTVSALLAEWQGMVNWLMGGKGGDVDVVNDVDVVSDVAVEGSKGHTVSLGIASILPIERDRRKAKRATPDRRTGTRTWFSPYYHAYRTAYGEPPTSATIKLTVRMIRGLEKEFGPAETLRRYGHYLASTPARFYAAARFAERFVAYKNGPISNTPKGGVPDPEPGESTDAYIARLANLGF